VIGFDAGTYNLVCCTRDANNNFRHNREVNAFVAIKLDDRFTFNMMKKSDEVPLIERDKVAYALGEAAVRMAYTISDMELRRPMISGCLNPKEKDAYEIMKVMVHSLIEDVKYDKELLYYSVPANAINEETDADYHSKILQAIFNAYESDEGYKVIAYPINEGLALIYAELASKNYTGMGVSCLCPGTKIYTKRGILPIEEVKEGDLVFTHKGRWRTVYNVVEKQFNGVATTVQIHGYSGDIDDYKFVDNHELYINRDGNWEWIGCDLLKPGDVVGEPIAFETKLLNQEILLEERTTCSKIIKVTSTPFTSNCCELIGYFLGDGSVNMAEGCIQFDFANKEIDNISRVQDLLKIVFDKPSTQTKKSDNCTRIKCYSKSLAKWFKNNCYNNKKKQLPVDVGNLEMEQCQALLRGLIMSDGRVAKEAICFYNINSSLAMVVKQLFAKLGIAANILHRKPRKGGIIDGRQIQGKSVEWTVTTGAKSSFEKLDKILDCGFHLNTIERHRTWVEEGFCCSRIRNIQKEEYTGIVYDLQVAEDHSFSGPNLTIRNCGAGMVNVCFAIYGVPVFQFSLVNSGDWIDKMAAKATQESVTFINQEKTKIDLSVPPTTLIERAIQTQYRIMIEKTVQGIKKGVLESGKKARTDHSIDIVIAGGTSIPNGFDILFKEIINQSDLPISVGTIVRPTDPLFSVARGCLIAAENATK
jgi:intein/homing endonuclease